MTSPRDQLSLLIAGCSSSADSTLGVLDFPLLPEHGLPPTAGPDSVEINDAPIPDEASSTAEVAARSLSPEVDAQRLLVEMGELVVKLQQRQEIGITTQEVSPEDLFARLAHFREVATSADLQCRA